MIKFLNVDFDDKYWSLFRSIFQGVKDLIYNTNIFFIEYLSKPLFSNDIPLPDFKFLELFTWRDFFSGKLPIELIKSTVLFFIDIWWFLVMYIPGKILTFFGIQDLSILGILLVYSTLLLPWFLAKRFIN